ncbi:hypothetical protein [Terrimonas pollutisoli]|uniref:hypothetical protein n=1 Tax=Terrimonas pollutisoli TaxID=3034147 RepID=UPI0023ECE24E|nr:hypothetical protein [Terrimonas sp. H1YJ31]
MKNKRLRNYLQQKATMKANSPIKADAIQNLPDKRIDQDFVGYPHAPAKEELINPKTKEQKKTAAVNVKDGEKMDQKNKKKQPGEERSDGSSNAFRGTEEVKNDD